MSRREYSIRRVSAEPDWSAIPALSVSEILWEPDAGIRMQAQLCYDDTALYVRMRAAEKNIRAEEKGPLAMVCEDSCMEFFFSPASDGRYFNLECSPNGCVYLGFGTTRALRVRLLIEDAAALLSLRTGRTEDGWEVRCALPFAFLRQFCPGFAPKTGDQMTGNCYKCGDKTVHPHYLAWNFVQSTAPDFHRPQDFGKLFFG